MLVIKDIMTTNVHKLQVTDSLADAKIMMNTHRIRHIPIVSEGNQFAGLITHRDLLSLNISTLAEIGQNEQNSIDQHIPVLKVMTTDVITASPDLDLGQTLQIMLENKYGCLPIVKGGQLVGIITNADFLQLTFELLKHQNAEEVLYKMKELKTST